MPRPDLFFDDRDFAAAVGDSCHYLPALLRDLIERSSVAFEHCLLTREQLPAPDYAIDVFGIELCP
jgi:hypothetical protein